MAHHFRAADSQSDGLVAGINPTPLVDVMLVLLIIFLITLPVVTQRVVSRLPQQQATPQQPLPRSVAISITGAGEIYWNQGRLRDLAQLAAMLSALRAQSPQSQLFLHADADLPYAQVAEVVGAVRRAGLSQLALVTEPGAAGAVR
jgi:biopolymer transport protein ExbD